MDHLAQALRQIKRIESKRILLARAWVDGYRLGKQRV